MFLFQEVVLIKHLIFASKLTWRSTKNLKVVIMKFALRNYVVDLCISLCRYEVKFQHEIKCGGAYIKLLSKSTNLKLVSKFTSLLQISITGAPNTVHTDLE